MTPSPTSEPELVTKPVAIGDPPEIADDAAETVAATSETSAAVAESDQVQPASTEQEPAGGAPVEAAAEEGALSQPALDQPASDQPASDQPALSQPASGQPASDEATAGAEPVAATQPAATIKPSASTLPSWTLPAKATPAASPTASAAAAAAASAQTTTPNPAGASTPPAPPEVVGRDSDVLADRNADRNTDRNADGEGDADGDGDGDRALAGGDVLNETDDNGHDGEPPYPPTTPGHYPTLVPLVGSLVALVALIALMVGAFAQPALHSGPNHLPIGVAGTPQITKQLSQLFDSLNPKGKHRYDITVYTQESALRTAIKHREVYGGLSFDGTTATMLVSSAGSPAATEDLASIANSLSGQQVQVSVSDVVPMPKKDPRGAGLSVLALPLVVATLLPALLMFRLYRRRAYAQLAATLAASVLIGLTMSAALTFWLDITQGANFWLLSAGLAAGVAATSMLVLGLGAIAGRVGVIVASAAVLLVSAPLSGFTSAPEWLPSPWNTIGQLLPAGASGTVLRSTAFFDGHGAGTALLVLAAWALIGLVLLVLGTALLPVKDEPELTDVEFDLVELDRVETPPAR